MASVTSNFNFIELKLFDKQNPSYFENQRRCSSVRRLSDCKSHKSIGDGSLGMSGDDIMSTSSGISTILSPGKLNQFTHSVHQRKRGVAVNCDISFDIGNFKQLSVDYSCSSQSNFTLEAKSKKGFPQFPSTPFKVLDIPGVEDNYYSNLLSWSDNNMIALCLSNTVYLFDYETSDADEFYQAYKMEKVTSLMFDPFGEKLAIGNVLGQVLIYDVERKKEIMSVAKHIDRVSCLDWSDKGLVSGSKDKKALLYDFRMRRHVANTFQNHTQEVCGIKWNRDGSKLATGGNDNKAIAWELRTNTPIMTMKHKAGVKALCWSTVNSDILVTGGGQDDQTIKSWNTAKDKMMFSRNIEGQVCVLLHSHLTNDIVTAKGNPENEIEVWRSNGFKKVGTLSGHTERPLYLAWSPDKSVLLSVSSDETMRFWEFCPTKAKKNYYEDDHSSSVDYSALN